MLTLQDAIRDQLLASVYVEVSALSEDNLASQAAAATGSGEKKTQSECGETFAPSVENDTVPNNSIVSLQLQVVVPVKTFCITEIFLVTSDFQM